MEFTDLYSIAESLVQSRSAASQRPLIMVSELVSPIVKNTSWLRCVNFYPISDCEDDGDPLGMFKCYAGQDAMYETENAWMAAVYQNSEIIGNNLCWQRFVRCKELMHIFDENVAYVDSTEAYTDLLEEIVTKPVGVPTKKIISENLAQWMALLILCPKSERDKTISDPADDYGIALRYRIPTFYVDAIRSEHYETAHKMLVK